MATEIPVKTLHPSKENTTMTLLRDLALLGLDCYDKTMVSFDVRNLMVSFRDADFQAVFASPLGEVLLGRRTSTEASCDQTLERNLKERVKKYLECDSDDEGDERRFSVLLLGAAALQLFVYNNWACTAVDIVPNHLVALLEDRHEVVVGALNVNGMDINVNTRYPELLWVSNILLGCEDLRSLTTSWWRLRQLFVHQQLLDEHSSVIFDEIKTQFALLMELDVQMKLFECTELRVLLYLEAVHIKMFYFDVKSAKEFLEKAQELAKLSLDFTGLLGKRTKFQQKAVAQFFVKVTDCEFLRTGCKDDDDESRLAESLPKNQSLHDEVRLEKIALSEPESYEHPYLSCIEQTIHIVFCLLLQKTSPASELKDEEMSQLTSNVLVDPHCWPVQMMALSLRSKLEGNHRRTIERSMIQMQVVVDQYDQRNASTKFRLRLLHASCLPPFWIMHSELAGLFCKMGARNSALDIYLRLRSWDCVIDCYQSLHRREKAEAVIREQLAIKETPALWCYLGEATDNPEHFVKAWELSSCRFARAQKLLGLMFYKQRQFKECVPHFQKCLEVNSLQLEVWIRLAFALMETEGHEAAARAYRHCTTLDAENFEIWNNLGNVYLKLKDKVRAWRTFQEAIRCNYEDWRVWENYLVVSTECRAFQEAIKAYHRLVDLKGKFVDEKVLEVLVRSICDEDGDIEGVSASRLRPKLTELFGRITSMVTNNGNVWRLYAELVLANDGGSNKETLIKASRHFQKAHSCFSQDSTWEKDSQSCVEVLDLTLRLADCCLTLHSMGEVETLPSAKLSVNRTVVRLKQYYSKMLTEEETVPQDVQVRLAHLENRQRQILQALDSSRQLTS